MDFLGKLRDLSGEKPVGFKLWIGCQREFMCIVKAKVETGVVPDFIAAEGGTGAVPFEFDYHVGMPMVEGLFRTQHASGCRNSQSGQTGRGRQGGIDV